MFTKRTLIFISLMAFFLPFLVRTNNKNSCKSYMDYFFINFGGNCFYNEDVNLSVPEIIKKYTGDVLSYNVTTEDGYILTMFRIYRRNPIGIILFQPPITTGSMAYLSDSASSLPFQLWQKGYDVWLSNQRGNMYSQKHQNKTEFWDFGFHEVAYYDLDAQFELISKTTGSKITYIGFSMGGTAGLIYASLKPEKAAKIIHDFILIAPLTILENFTSWFKFLIYILDPFEKFFRTAAFPEFYAVRLLERFTAAPFLVNIFSSFLLGWTPSEMDPMLFPYIVAHHGKGVSNQMVFHYGQIFLNQTHFRQYDYGPDLNLLKYGTHQPPSYRLDEIKNKMHFIQGDRDQLANPEDIKTICEKILPKENVAGVHTLDNHNHIDYFFSKHRKTKTYNTIFKILNEIQSRN